MAKWRQKGGGYIGKIESVTFEDKTWESENAKDGAYRTGTAKLMVLKDGADEAIAQYLPVGFFYDGQGVSKDGKTLTDKNSKDAPIIDGGSNFARFIDTLEDAGFDTSAFEATNYRNFEALEGKRIEFKNEIDLDRQMASGRKKLGIKKAGSLTGKGGKTYTEAEVMEAGKRQDKNDKKKFYNQTRLTAVKVFDADAAGTDDADEEEETPVKPVKGAKAKAAPAPEPDEDEDDAEETGPSNKEAVKMLTGILKEEDGEINRADLTLLVARKIKDRGQRDAMTKKLFSTDFLREENGWSFNESSKKQAITLDS